MPIGQQERAVITDAPFITGGKLEYSFGDDDYYCSAQLVGALDVILTAGHCVWDRERSAWYNDFQFRLGAEGSSESLTIDWECVGFYQGWAEGKYQYDYAFIKLRGKGLSAAGLKTNTIAQKLMSIGYPSNIDSGRTMRYVNGNRSNSGQPAIIKMPSNPFREGSSGGGWLTSKFVEGLNSFGLDSEPNTMFGPLFNFRTPALFEFVNKGCETQQSSEKAQHDTLMESLAKNRGGMIMSSYKPEIVEVSVTPSEQEYIRGVSGKSNVSCDCETGKPMLLNNPTQDIRFVKGNVISKHIPSGTITSSQPLELVLNPNESKLLGCSIYSNEGDDCKFSSSLEIENETRIITADPVSLDEKTQANMQTMKIADIHYCLDICIDEPGNPACLHLTDKAIPVIEPISRFVSDLAIDVSPPGETIIAKKDIVENLGGNPVDFEDPCFRSGIFKMDKILLANSGAECLIVTKDVLEGGNDLSLSLQLPSQIESRSKDETLVSGKKISTANFDRKANSPSVIFNGPSAEYLNNAYGGTVLGVAKSSATKSVVLTQNGCIEGPHE